MKKVILALLTISVAVLIFFSRKEISNIFVATSEAKYRWLFAAIIAQLFVYFFLISAHKCGLKIAGVYRNRRELTGLLLGALVVNSTVPSGGTSGTLVFVNDSKRRGESGLATGTGIILAIVANYIALLAILIIALIFLRLRGELGVTEMVSTSILFIFVVIVITLGLIAKNDPERMKTLLRKINGQLYKVRYFFSKKAVTSDAWVNESVKEISNASTALHEKPLLAFETVLMDLLSNFFNIVTIYFLFLAFGQKVGAGVLISGYAIGELFKIISPSPEGIGVTEVSMAVVYSSFGINPLVATSIALIYRGLNYWIPFGLGFLYLQRNNLKST